ncbi:MAG: hypothetical protein LCI00_25580 [Chloroflexi bacterium]|nr:hypothetical protein [Chloroflexota bacterium]MCC6895402.1 hypothetical protein [Anaerolineae bacterium]
MATQIKVPIYHGLVDYLANLATPQQILAFKISEDMQARLEELFEKNNEGDTTPEERAELDEFVEFDQHVMILKARAASAINSKPTDANGWPIGYFDTTYGSFADNPIERGE